MEHPEEQVYRIATFAVVIATAFLCLLFLLIFVNPQFPLNPLKPRPPALAVITPTAASVAPTQVSVDPPATAVTATRPPVFSPTRTLSPHFFQPVLQGCSTAEGTGILGTVWIGAEPQEDVRVRVAASADPQTVIARDTTRPRPDGTITFHIVLKARGSFGASPATWYVWTADEEGKPTSDPNFHVTTNNLPKGDRGSCWFVNVDFAH